MRDWKSSALLTDDALEDAYCKDSRDSVGLSHPLRGRNFLSPVIGDVKRGYHGN